MAWRVRQIHTNDTPEEKRGQYTALYRVRFCFQARYQTRNTAWGTVDFSVATTSKRTMAVSSRGLQRRKAALLGLKLHCFGGFLVSATGFPET